MENIEPTPRYVDITLLFPPVWKKVHPVMVMSCLRDKIVIQMAPPSVLFIMQKQPDTDFYVRHISTVVIYKDTLYKNNFPSKDKLLVVLIPAVWNPQLIDSFVTQLWLIWVFI